MTEFPSFRELEAALLAAMTPDERARFDAALEAQRDSAEMKVALAADDGGRVSIDALVAELDAEEAAAR